MVFVTKAFILVSNRLVPSACQFHTILDPACPADNHPGLPTVNPTQPTPSTGKLARKTALVTGASSGIGQAIAIELASQGADLFLHARTNKAGLDKTIAAVQPYGVSTKTWLCDLQDSVQPNMLVDAAWEWRDINIFVHAAGADVLTGEASEECFEEKLRRLWEVDVRGTILACRAIGERMTSGGAILTIGWDQASTGMEGDSGQMFGTTKGAIEAFTLALAKTLAPAVRVNCLAPGWIQTKWGDDAPEYWRQRATEEALLKRWGTPDDIAKAAAWLVSPDASFITGQVVPVNGGFAGSRP